MRPDVLMTRLGGLLILFVLAGQAAWGQQSSARQTAVRCAVTYADEYRVPFELVAAVIQVESGWNPRAVSNKGAVGLMQLMADTARRFGVHNRFDIDQNVHGGVAYLAWLIQLFRGDLRLAVAAYQVGEATILVRGLQYASPEVFRYVSRVAQLYRAYCKQAVASRVRSAFGLEVGGE